MDSVTQRPIERRSDTSPESAPPMGQYYDVAGVRLLLHQSGNGGPAVVFLAGGGTVGLDYLNVQQRAAELTTSVTYDRAGTGWSDSVDLPRASVEITDELRALLRVAEVPPPYVMVGHSLGGLYARHYAQRFSGEVAGLVLLDPAHEDYNAYMPKDLVDHPYLHGLGEIRLIEDVGHVTLHFRRPDAVLQAIQDLLDSLDEQSE